ncbi:hypothetical protein NLI96_g12984 [Meripilus lineatus]|uniref:Uncharacterized protein n=1 Tax=Meripilus lineatus TaxID=2056292 RepID=A0AAD5YBW6_9APHY|nr:hypothetical protein NLI96_g12984 [Physisporinus lineatus]
MSALPLLQDLRAAAARKSKPHNICSSSASAHISQLEKLATKHQADIRNLEEKCQREIDILKEQQLRELHDLRDQKQEEIHTLKVQNSREIERFLEINRGLRLEVFEARIDLIDALGRCTKKDEEIQQLEETIRGAFL